MAIITVVDNPDEYEEDGKRIQIPFKPGKTLRAILNATEHRVRTGCLGNGACGLCLIRIIDGETAPPCDNECLQLSSEQLASGVRLACLVICNNDLTVEIINRVPVSAWRTIPEEQYHHASDKPHDKPHDKQYPLLDISTYLSRGITRPCGVAVDLGTTSISLTLFELGNGRLLTTRHGINPQIKDGLDILTRVNIAVESLRDSSRLQHDLLTAIKEALWDMSVADGIDLGQVCRMVFVGNTAILTLLTGANFQLLLDPRYWSRHLPLQLPDTSNWSIDWGIHPLAEIKIIPPLAGFVGSDLTAGILAADLTDKPGTLLIDFGTNSEMALWDGNRIWVTSAAGGPAFEGSGISCGMPAEKGAIYRLDLKEKKHSVIGQSKPVGICGSALVDLIADLVDTNLLTNIGQFSETTSGQSFELPETDIRLHKRDVDLLQRAKSAIATGIQILLQQAGMDFTDLNKVFISGAFGYYLDIAKAQKIGLLPPIPLERFKLYGNSAINGCEQILLRADADEKLTVIAQQFKIVNLAESEDFDESFFQNLFLEAMKQ